MKIKTAVRPNPARCRVMQIAALFLISALILIIYTGTLKAAGLVTISPKQAREMIIKEKGNPDFVILDIRTPREFKAGHIEDAVMIDFYAPDFLKKMKALDKSKTYLMYCRSANRSTKALHLIKKMGFASVNNMGRGIVGWRQLGYPLVK